MKENPVLLLVIIKFDFVFFVISILALVIQHAVPSVTCLSVPYFSTLSHKQHDFRGTFTEHKMGVLIFSTTFVWNTSHSRNNSTRCHKCIHRASCKVHVILVRLYWNLNFYNRFSKKLKYQIWWKSTQWELSCSTLADRQSDMTILDGTSYNFQMHQKCSMNYIHLRVWLLTQQNATHKNENNDMLQV